MFERNERETLALRLAVNSRFCVRYCSRKPSAKRPVARPGTGIVPCSKRLCWSTPPTALTCSHDVGRQSLETLNTKRRNSSSFFHHLTFSAVYGFLNPFPRATLPGEGSLPKSAFSHGPEPVFPSCGSW